MADQTLEIQIKTLAELGGIKSAVKELNNLKISSNNTQKEMSGLFSGLSSTLAAIPKQLIGVGAGFLTFRAAANFIGEAVAEANKAEVSLNRLKSALAATGEETANNIRQFQEFAEKIQLTTQFEDDLVIEQLAVAKSFGLTNSEARKLVESATDLAAMTGGDLSSATSDLLKSLTGQLPRSVKLLGTEFANLTEEQLKSAAVQDLIAQKFGGRAESDINTLTGAYRQFTNALSGFTEQVGVLVIDAFSLVDVVKSATSAIAIFQNVVSKPSVSALNETLKETEKDIKNVTDALTGGAVSFNTFASAAKIALRSIFQDSRQEIEIKIKEQSIAEIEEVKEKIFTVDQGAKQKFLEEIRRVGLTTVEIAKQERDARLDELKKIFGDESKYSELSVEDRKAAVNAKIKIEKEFTSAVLKNQKDQSAKEAAELRNRQEIYKNAASNMAAAFANVLKGKGTKEELTGLAFGVGQAFTEGKDGAKKILTGGVQAVGDAIIPGVGSALSPIVGALSSGKEAAKQFVSEFLDSIPDLVEGLIHGIISAWQTLVTKIPEIIDRIIDSLPGLITAIIEAIPSIFFGFYEAVTQGAITFVDSLIENIPKIVEAFVKGVANTPRNLGRGVGKIFSFAEGGQFVKSVPPGFGNGSTERFPAVLGSGELVVDRSTAFKLKEFLNTNPGSFNGNNEGSQSMMDAVMALANRAVVVQIDGREIARSTRNQLKSGFVI